MHHRTNTSIRKNWAQEAGANSSPTMFEQFPRQQPLTKAQCLAIARLNTRVRKAPEQEAAAKRVPITCCIEITRRPLDTARSNVAAGDPPPPYDSPRPALEEVSDDFPTPWVEDDSPTSPWVEDDSPTSPFVEGTDAFTPRQPPVNGTDSTRPCLEDAQNEPPTGPKQPSDPPPPHVMIAAISSGILPEPRGTLKHHFASLSLAYSL